MSTKEAVGGDVVIAVVVYWSTDTCSVGDEPLSELTGATAGVSGYGSEVEEMILECRSVGGSEIGKADEGEISP